MLFRDRLKDHHYWLERAAEAATTSPHPKVKVGAVLVDPYNREISWAANDFAPGVQPKAARLKDGHKSDWFECAEQTTIAKAAAEGRATTGATLYATQELCTRCAGAAVAAKIICVVIPDAPEHPHFKEKWLRKIEAGRAKLAEAKITVLKIKLG